MADSEQICRLSPCWEVENSRQVTKREQNYKSVFVLWTNSPILGWTHILAPHLRLSLLVVSCPNLQCLIGQINQMRTYSQWSVTTKNAWGHMQIARLDPRFGGILQHGSGGTKYTQGKTAKSWLFQAFLLTHAGFWGLRIKDGDVTHPSPWSHAKLQRMQGSQG